MYFYKVVPKNFCWKFRFEALQNCCKNRKGKGLLTSFRFAKEVKTRQMTWKALKLKHQTFYYITWYWFWFFNKVSSYLVKNSEFWLKNTTQYAKLNLKASLWTHTLSPGEPLRHNGHILGFATFFCNFCQNRFALETKLLEQGSQTLLLGALQCLF